MLPPRPYELSGVYPDIFLGLLGLSGIPLSSSVGRDNVALGLVLGDFHAGNVAVQLADILADQLIAFAHLDPY